MCPAPHCRYGKRQACARKSRAPEPPRRRYLCNRKQFTDFKNTHSEPCEMKFGVPQGSVLGPLLSLLYINDITNASQLGHFILFADDTNIFVTGKTEEEAFSRANIVSNSGETLLCAAPPPLIAICRPYLEPARFARQNLSVEIPSYLAQI